MFTQCPSCNKAFKVTTAQLQQASGKVRCGGCQNVFNALDSFDDNLTDELTDELGPDWLRKQSAAEPDSTAEPDVVESDPEDTATAPAVDEQAARDNAATDVNLEEITYFDDNTGIGDVAEPAITDRNDPDFVEPDNEPETHLETDVFEESLIRNLEGLTDEVAETTGEFDEEELTPDDGPVYVIESDPEEADESGPDNDDTDIGRNPYDQLPDADSNDDGYEFSYEADQDIDNDLDDDLDDDGEDAIPDGHLDTLEFDVPKKQWGKFFSGRYEGPVIEPVGPLGGDMSDGGAREAPATETGTTGAELPAESPREDEGWEDIEAISTSDDLNSDLTDEAADDAQDTADSDDEDSLRVAIDTLTMEEDQWRRMHLETSDEEVPPFLIRTDDNIVLPDASQPDPDAHDLESHDFESPVETPSADSASAQNKHQPDEPPPGWAYEQGDEEHEPKSKRTLWLLLALLILGTGLGAQLVHHNRENLAAHPQYGKQIRSVYALINKPVFPAWDLEAYEIRGWEAISGESGEGLLDIRAQLAVTGKQAMGEPLIKIVLKDRWGKEVTSQVFTPEQYSKGMRPPNGLIPSGAIVPIRLTITDPGTRAQNFELTVCLPRETDGPQCKGP